MRFLRLRSFSSSSSFSRSFLLILSSRSRVRSPGRPPELGAGASVAEAGTPGRAVNGRAPGAVSGRNGPLPCGRRCGAGEISRPGCGVRAAGCCGGAPFPGWPGRGATPGRPGKPVCGPGEADADVVGGGAARRGRIEVWPEGTGRSLGIGVCGAGGTGAGRCAAGAGGTGTGLAAAGGGGTMGTSGSAGTAGLTVGGAAERRELAGTGLSVGMDSAGAAVLGATRCSAPLEAARRGAAGAPFAWLAGAEAVAVAVVCCGGAAGFASTLRTKSAMWSGTTLSWFFASKTPPSRSLKRVTSSFEVSPTSFASSNIRTFPLAKICLSSVQARSFGACISTQLIACSPSQTRNARPGTGAQNNYAW